MESSHLSMKENLGVALGHAYRTFAHTATDGLTSPQVHDVACAAEPQGTIPRAESVQEQEFRCHREHVLRIDVGMDSRFARPGANRGAAADLDSGVTVKDNAA